MDFLDKILPRQGYYCTAKLVPTGGFQHRFFDSLEETKKHLKAADAAGATMYIAQATFKTQDSRKGANALMLRNFFLDIDCGPKAFKDHPEHAHPNQQLGARAIIEFCRATGLPTPFLVSSGNGLYAHWSIMEDIPADQWKGLAITLKKLTGAFHVEPTHAYDLPAGFVRTGDFDPMRTADAASVLRPTGTHNRKGGEIKEVRLLNLSSVPIPLRHWVTALDAAAKQVGVESMIFTKPTIFKGIDDEFTAGLEGPPSSLEKIAVRCAQISRIKDLQGDVSEPLWYDFIGLARFTQEVKEDGNGIIHDWSAGHPDYSADATDGKISHHAGSGAGPTTCARFGVDSPTECVACPHANKIKSPIVLGRPEAVSIAETAEEENDLPYGFTRTKEGLHFKGPEDVDAARFYPYDLYLVKIAYDYSLRYETVTIRHQLPVSKIYQEFTVGSHLIHDPKSLLMELAKNHVQTSGKEARNLMLHYVDSYMSKLRANRNLSALYSQMGWHQDEGEMVFVLGEAVLRKGEDQVTGFAQNIPGVAKHFRPEGDLNAWSSATAYLGLPGMQGLAFAFLCGAFGAPLFRFTGYAGAMVALVGKTGIGKTLVGEWALSTYGDPDKLRMQKNDTVNSTFSRLGLYGSLPIYLDEISNIEGKDLSDLLYGITQGREKLRLHRSGQERAAVNEWNTIAVASSNHGLGDKLSNLKADASAELNRIIEIKVFPVEAFGREQATAVHRAFYENFGVAGPIYAKYLVENQDRHQANIDKITADLDRRTDATGEERFWSAVAASAIYGGLIAKRLGLIRFNVEPVMEWVVTHILSMRKNKADQVLTQVDILGQMLDDLAGGALICSDSKNTLVQIIKEPRGAVTYRIDTDANRLYIPRSVVKRYVDKHYGSYSSLRDELCASGAMLNDNSRKVLGSGTYIGGTQQPCWVVDLACPALGRNLMALVRRSAGQEAANG